MDASSFPQLVTIQLIDDSLQIHLDNYHSLPIMEEQSIEEEEMYDDVNRESSTTNECPYARTHKKTRFCWEVLFRDTYIQWSMATKYVSNILFSLQKVVNTAYIARLKVQMLN